MVPGGVDARTLAFAVIKTLKPDVDVRDVVAVRPLVRKTTLLSTNVEPRDSEATSDVPSSAATTVPTRPPPLLVTLSNRPLALEIIRCKVEFGKLHTSKIIPNLPTSVDAASLTPGLINVNELLPKEMFMLHQQVRLRAQQPGSGFVTFVRSGIICVRKKKCDTVAKIFSIEELDNFLAL